MGGFFVYGIKVYAFIYINYMKNLSIIFVAVLVFLASTGSADAAKSTTQTSVKTSAQKQAIIRKSIANYKGNCPCPWNTMRNGRSCGKTSAWSKPGGAQPICYEWEIK